MFIRTGQGSIRKISRIVARKKRARASAKHMERAASAHFLWRRAVSVATLPFCHCPRVTNQTTPVASTTKRFLRRGLSVCSDHVARPYYLCSASQSRPRMIRLSVQAAAKKSLTLRRPVRNNQAIKQGWWAALPPACSYPAQQLFCDGRAFPNIFPNIYCNHPSTMTL
jgi:hypothetical protein